MAFLLRTCRRLCVVQAVGARRWSSTIAPEEAAKFSQVEWWAEDSWMMKSLNSMNSLRVPLIKNSLLQLPLDAPPTSCHTPSPLHGYSILDVGCGAGFLSEPLARLGAEVTGLELSEQAVAVAVEHARHDPEVAPRVEYRCQTIEDYRREEGGRQFDCVMASEVVEHVANLSLFLHALCSFLKPGGYAIFTTINRTPSSLALAIVAAEYLLGVLPPGTHHWDKFVTPAELTAGLEWNGVQVDMLRGMAFQPLMNKWVWSEDSSVNYALRGNKPQSLAP